MLKRIFILALPLVLFSCGQHANKKPMSDNQAYFYNSTLSSVTSLEDRLSEMSTASAGDIESFMTSVSRLHYLNDTTGMRAEDKELCMELKQRVNVLKHNADSITSSRLMSMLNPVEVNEDCLLEKATAYPIYLERGDILYYDIQLQKPGTINLYNADSRTVLKTYKQRVQLQDSLVVQNKGIYLVEIVPLVTQYADIHIQFQMRDHLHPIKEVKSEEVECGPKDFRVIATKGIKMRSVFEQPRKATLRSQLKSMFSGTSRAIVAIQIPAGATDILYSLRISTSEQDRSSDGKFPDNMNVYYNRIRFMGLPLYENSYGSGLFNTLLDDNRPLREEDAYCNMYVFRSQSAAKLFQDYSRSASQLQYDVDYSTLGTQSCDGRIPTKGAKTIYLAFENERVRYSNYIWVEVIAATPITEYHTTKYSLAE